MLFRSDPIPLTWRLSPDTHRLYIGALPGQHQRVFTVPAGQNHITVDMPEWHYAWLTAFDGVLESPPTPPVQYRPVTAELVLGHLFSNAKEARWDLFHAPDVLFDPASLNIPQVLEWDGACVIIHTPRGDFSAEIDRSDAAKYLRSYVAARP